MTGKITVTNKELVEELQQRLVTLAVRHKRMKKALAHFKTLPAEELARRMDTDELITLRRRAE